MPGKKRKSNVMRSKRTAAALLALYTDLNPRAIARALALPERQVWRISRLLRGGDGRA